MFLNFGCNKGYDSLSIARIVSRQGDVFNKQKWKDALGITHRGICFQAEESSNLSYFDSDLRKRPVGIHCIEAMPKTAAQLRHAAEVTRAAQYGFHTYNYAMVGTTAGSGSDTILFPSPEGKEGVEDFSIEKCNDPELRPLCKEVPAKTVDQFVKEHVDTKTQANTRRIPYIT